VRPWLGRIAFGLGLLGGGCRQSSPHSIEIRVGTGPSDQVIFVPKSAFFEYLELPLRKNELEITLASYELSCERYVSPAEGESSVRVVVLSPAGVAPTPGEYPCTAPEDVASTKPEQSRAVPKAFVGKRSHLFQPGGFLRLNRVAVDKEGLVEGTLAFEFPGNLAHPATSVKGSFRAKMCRVERAKER
jgi:hypothetical protein